MGNPKFATAAKVPLERVTIAQLIMAGQLARRIVESGSYTYIAYALEVGALYSESKWQVQRIDESGNLVFADGDAQFNNTCSDMTALTYPDPNA
jgi:chorismate synthase